MNPPNPVLDGDDAGETCEITTNFVVGGVTERLELPSGHFRYWTRETSNENRCSETAGWLAKKISVQPYEILLPS